MTHDDDASSTSPPLFERHQTQEHHYVQRLQDELQDTKGLLEAQAQRQYDLEYVNEDLERRLEHEALEKIQLENDRQRDGQCLEQERADFEIERREWRARLAEEERHHEALEERLRRTEKELYRMHQKKYDIEKLVRQEEQEKHRAQAWIVKGIVEENNNSNNKRQSKPQQKCSSTSNNKSQQQSVRHWNHENPLAVHPRTVRWNQAWQSACDFLGVSGSSGSGSGSRARSTNE